MDVEHLLKQMVVRGASDMFLSAESPIRIKVDGHLEFIDKNIISAEIIMDAALKLMGAAGTAQFRRDLEYNMAIRAPTVGRFRVNVFNQRNTIAMVIRSIKSVIPSLDELLLPEIYKRIIMGPRGLVLVVGATGSGKSTTLASMVDYRNKNSAGHILTIEDPIEYVHEHKKSIVNQREVGMDTHSYGEALKNAMREAPDVILIGEIRDTDTMDAAIGFSETGHLCLATLHSNNSDQAVERILNFFPEASHHNILRNLSLNLKAIISQRLVVDKQGILRPACEVLINTPRIADLLRRGEIQEIKGAMQESLEDGIQTFDQAIYEMYKADLITAREALAKADSRTEMELKIRLGGSGKMNEEGTQTDTTASGLLTDDPYGLNSLQST